MIFLSFALISMFLTLLIFSMAELVKKKGEDF
jgi:hypothetical protein